MYLQAVVYVNKNPKLSRKLGCNRFSQPLVSVFTFCFRNCVVETHIANAPPIRKYVGTFEGYFRQENGVKVR
jgi:hypothetical protein